MPTRITSADVQVWLEPTKLRIDSGDSLAEEIPASEIVLSKLATRFDTSGWIDETDTPDLVRQVIAMLVASFRYNSIYSETEDAGNPYADKLKDMADNLIMGILDGSIDLIDEPLQGPAVTGTLEFFPTDKTGADDLSPFGPEEGVRFKIGTVY